MKNRYKIFKWLFVAGIMCGGSHTLSTAYAYNQVTQPASWGYQSVNTAMTTNRSTSVKLSEDICPSYQFKPTSYYSSIVGTTSSTETYMNGGIRKTDPWGDPEDDPIGVLPDPAPVGEPLILLLMALLYAICTIIRRSKNVPQNHPSVTYR